MKLEPGYAMLSDPKDGSFNFITKNLQGLVGCIYHTMEDHQNGDACRLHPFGGDCVQTPKNKPDVYVGTPACQPFTGQRSNPVEAKDHAKFGTIFGDSGSTIAMAQKQQASACVIEEVMAFGQFSKSLGEKPIDRFIREMRRIRRDDGGGQLYIAHCALSLCASDWVNMRRPRTVCAM